MEEPKLTIEILEDAPYSGDGMYWHNVESEDREIEGIYKTSYNLQERIKEPEN